MRAEKLIPHCLVEYQAIADEVADRKAHSVKFWESVEERLSNLRHDMDGCKPHGEAAVEWRHLWKSIEELRKEAESHVISLDRKWT